MDVQEIIMWIVVFCCFVAAGRRLYGYYKRIKNNESPCASCGGACHCKKEDTKEDCCCEKEN